MHRGYPLNIDENSTERLVAETPNVRVTGLEVQGERYVLKASSKILNRKPKEGETVDACKDARFKESLVWLRSKKDGQNLAMHYIQKEGAYAPREHYIITEDEEGMPYALVVQREVANAAELRTRALESLSFEERADLKRLLVANRKCFLENGVGLDLIGSVGIDEEKAPYIKKFLLPLKYSTNILVTRDGRTVLIDPQVDRKNPVMQFLKFLAMEKEYWRLISLDIREELFNKSRELRSVREGDNKAIQSIG